MTWLLLRLTGKASLWIIGILLPVIIVLLIQVGHQRLVHARLQADVAVEHAKLADMATQAVIRAREAERLARDQITAARDQYQQERHDADLAMEKTLAGVRAGTVRLRHDLVCPGRVPEAAGAAAGTTEATPGGFRAEDAVAAIRIAHDGDDAIRLLNECIAVAKADRSAK